MTRLKNAKAKPRGRLNSVWKKEECANLNATNWDYATEHT